MTGLRGIINMRSINGGITGPTVNAGPLGISSLVAIGGGISANVNSAGPLLELATTGNLTGNVNVVNLFVRGTVLGNMVGSTVTVTGSALGTLYVRGNIVQSYIRIEDVNNQVAGYMHRLITGGDFTNSSLDTGGLGAALIGGLITEDNTDADFDVIHATGGIFYVRDASGVAGWVSAGNPLWFDEGQPLGQQAFVA